MIESGVRFGTDRSLIGVLTTPRAGGTTSGLGVVILNAGLTHRVGPNRVHVRIARRCAQQGHGVLRFDLSGVGDSPPADDHRDRIERGVAEVREAMDYLTEQTGVRQFVSIGSCSGALLSFTTALVDPRIVALGLVNPPTPTLLRHFLRTAGSHLSTWRRLLKGRSRIRAQYDGLMRRSARLASGQTAQDVTNRLSDLTQRGVDVLLVLSQWDPSYDYYEHVLQKQISAAGASHAVQAEVIPGADHQLSLVANQNRLVEIVDAWMADVTAQPAIGGPHSQARATTSALPFHQ